MRIIISAVNKTNVNEKFRKGGKYIYRRGVSKFIGLQLVTMNLLRNFDLHIPH